eukprot:4273019-Pleurochrysis_carterae.AAC.1
MLKVEEESPRRWVQVSPPLPQSPYVPAADGARPLLPASAMLMPPCAVAAAIRSRPCSSCLFRWGLAALFPSLPLDSGGASHFTFLRSLSRISAFIP